MTPWGAEGEIDAQALFGRAILQVVPALDSSASACVELAASLAEVGARALVAGRPGRLVSELQARGGVFTSFAAATRNPWQAWRNRRRLAQLALREGVELIHVRSGADAYAALHAARQARVPLVADFEPGDEAVALEADSIIFYARELMETVLARRPALAAKAVRGLHGVDLRVFSPEAVEAARVRRLREALGVKPHVRLVVALELPAERRQNFLAAAAQLKARNFFANDAQEARFVWLRGEGETASPAFDAEAARLGLGELVLQIDWPDRAAACLAAALVVAPAQRSALCVEAQALGAPLAALQASGERDEVEVVLAPPQVEAALRTGWLAQPGPPAALIRAIEEALRLGATARENLAHRARAHARNFSTERMNAITLAVYARHFGAGDQAS
ncbi:glycosyl transferase [Rhodoblastus acidophilus]|uniref:Glycosyl transferase n=1 Tax=Candidatus Rhodoblastus alkanivorans TaxID=2954117 RepID=A0ABS9Z2S8_9HYPH|nr:glycosyl transferase [Candidatus Rhodoblastus alkanivorans]MCI4678040.1 glycosyl transferase [Candidatus Rhodoblastus alkanivorans]MCI4681620.1 glycosyl transferase [Candidatus Rhodoblastus alkanivorans]MDI4642667.1 glycosyl transferase [Rhodoblastus acidophilus]